jgi:hypothetical protein
VWGREIAYRSLENTFITPVRLAGLPDFILGGIWIHNPILPRNLLLVPNLIRLLLLPKLLQLVRELRLQIPDLTVLRRIASRPRSVRLKKLDLVFDLRVECLGLGDERFDLRGGGAVRGGDGALVGGGYGADGAGEGADLLAHAIDAGEEVGIGEDRWAGGRSERVLWCRARLRVLRGLGVV